MKPRYFIGTGEPPIHVSDIQVGSCPQVTYKGGGRSETKFDCESKETFLALLLDLQQHRVPFSVGGHFPGPADTLVMSLQSKGFNGFFVQISWYGPNKWEVREMDKETVEWQEAANLEDIANTSFNPDAQERRTD
jgi:hypothetical protein